MKGKIKMAIDVLTLFSMIAQLYSGIVLSLHVFAFFPFERGLVLLFCICMAASLPSFAL